jgi:large subunit ribosomal protein L24
VCVLNKLHVRKNDTVLVIAGKDRGKQGRIQRVFTKENRAMVEKLNLVKRHLRPTRQGQPGGVVEKEAPIHVSNLMLICSSCNQPTRVQKKVLENGRIVRVCRKCGEMIDRG